MTPDLPTRVREAFDAEFDARRSLAARPRMDAALAAVIAVVQEDRTREIVAWAMRNAASMKRTGNTGPADRWESTANAITREFGGTTHD